MTEDELAEERYAAVFEEMRVALKEMVSSDRTRRMVSITQEELRALAIRAIVSYSLKRAEQLARDPETPPEYWLA